MAIRKKRRRKLAAFCLTVSPFHPMRFNSPTVIFSESGNVLLIILLAIFLIGALSVAIQGTGQQNAAIDRESMALKIAQVEQYAGEIERGVVYILQSGNSEADLRFAHADAEADYGEMGTGEDRRRQIFAKEGGAVTYRGPPSIVNDGSKWEFFGDTALPEVGSDAPELSAVLPHVTQVFCEMVNAKIGYESGVQPLDSGVCINGGGPMRFNSATQFATSPNTVDESTFTRRPSTHGCIKCADGTYHYFRVLLAR
jgi:hypothetical protein